MYERKLLEIYDLIITRIWTESLYFSTTVSHKSKPSELSIVVKDLQHNKIRKRFKLENINWTPQNPNVELSYDPDDRIKKRQKEREREKRKKVGDGVGGDLKNSKNSSKRWNLSQWKKKGGKKSDVDNGEKGYHKIHTSLTDSTKEIGNVEEIWWRKMGKRRRVLKDTYTCKFGQRTPAAMAVLLDILNEKLVFFRSPWPFFQILLITARCPSHDLPFPHSLYDDVYD